VVQRLAILVLPAVAALAAAGGGAATTTPRPALRVVATAPVAVLGTHFHRHEPVAVMVSTGTRSVTRRAVASATGSFRATTSLSVDRCGDGLLVVRATGARGSKAALKYPLPECPPEP